MQSSIGIKKILFPTDFSKSSEAVAAYTAGLAKATGAKIVALNVVPWLSAWHGVSEPYFEVGDDVLRKLSESQREIETVNGELVRKIKDRYFRDIECDAYVRTGGVAESIVECADEFGVDMIMIPTKGAGSPRPFLIGSVTAKVLHDARCAVWTSPHPRELEEFRPYRQIVCAIDHRVLYPELLERAAEVAQIFGSRLSVVSAIPYAAAAAAATVRATGEHHGGHSARRETVSALEHLLHKLSIRATLHVMEGTVGESIRDAVLMEDGDLVVIGRGHLDEASGHLRTHAYEIIWNSPCPVLSV